MVEVGVVFAKELARVVAGRVDYDKAVVISMLSGVLECCDYVEFPFYQGAIDKFFEEDGVFAHQLLIRINKKTKRHKGQKFFIPRARGITLMVSASGFPRQASDTGDKEDASVLFGRNRKT